MGAFNSLEPLSISFEGRAKILLKIDLFHELLHLAILNAC